MHNFITWYDILTVFIWTITIYTVIAVVLLAISRFTENLRNKNGALPREKPQPKERFKIVERSNKDDYNFQTEDHLQVPLKNVNRMCIEIAEGCQNRMPNGRCTSFVCTKIVRFK